jgi:RNA polymerase sigma factor (sigma-70 family)
MASTDTTQNTAGRDLVLEIVSEHASSMLAVARRYSLCADDAHDACQRGLEILLRRADSLDPAGAPAWLRTVVKHEALAIRAARRRIVGPLEVDLDRTEARELEPAEDRAAASERMGRSTEALSRLKPQELRALVLKARGYSYKEIAEITGWTYTKVNRCLTEGRRAFLDRYGEIESGVECARWASTLSALADGEASAQDVAAIRPHLRHCSSCRASLRAFRAAPGMVALAAGPAALVSDPSPGAALTDDGGDAGLVSRAWDAIAGGLHERVLLSAHKLQAGVEAASAGKLAAVAASATALAGGGAAALHAGSSSPAVGRSAAVTHAAPEATTPADEPSPAPASSPTPAAARPDRAPASPPAASPPAAARPAPPGAEFAPGGGAEAEPERAPAVAPRPAPARRDAPASQATATARTPSTEFGP